MCNIRWRKAQVMSACRDMREMVLTKSLCGLNEFASELILRYANLDLVFCRKDIDFQMYSRMLHETWTHVVHSDDEYFVDDSIAVFTVPLICLGDETLTSVAVQREILKDLPSQNETVDVIEINHSDQTPNHLNHLNQR